MLRALHLLLVVLASCRAHAFSSMSGSGGSGENGDLEDSRIPLKFILMLSNADSFNSWGSIPAVDIALSMVNESGLLGDYLLTYSTPLDSQCDRTQSLDMFNKVVHKKDNLTYHIGLIGAGCSSASLPVAEISHYYNIPMISWASAAAELSNRARYRMYYRTVPSVEIHSPGVAALLQYYEWKQVAILTEAQSLFVNGQKVIIGLLPDVDIVVREFASTDDALKVEDLFVKDRDMRIFVLNMYVNHARRILCQGFHKGMYYPRYTWITPGWYGDDWWTKELPVVLEENKTNCTLENMKTVLVHSLSAVQYPLVNESEVSDLGLSFDDFKKLYGRQLHIEKNENNISYKPDLTSPLAFDAVWTLAFALNFARDKIKRCDEGGCAGVEGDLVPLEEFDYHNKKMGCLLKESMDEVFFHGVSGNVTFDSTGNRVGNSVRISQYIIGPDPRSQQEAILTPFIGYAVFEGDVVNVSHLELQFDFDVTTDNRSMWPDGVTPDGIPVKTIVTTVLPLTITYYILASVGILFALVCLGFNIIFRNKKVVRLTSPNLNYLIIAGAILIYISVFFWVSPAKEEFIATVLCNLRVWFFSIGNTLCLAVVLSKMWRVYHIFSAPSPKRKPKPPQDWHLLIISSVIVSVDLLILVVSTSIKAARVRGQLTESKEHTATRDHLGVRQEHLYYSCYTDSHIMILLLFMSYIYKFLLQVAAIYFAFMSRKVKVKALNDSKEIAAIIYITSLLLVISAIGFWIGLIYLNTSTAVFGLAELLTATVILGLLFIPKMVNLRKDPEGNNIFTTTNPSIPSIMGTESNQKLLDLTQRVKELESELERYQGESGENGVTAYTIPTATPTLKNPGAIVGTPPKTVDQ